MKPFNEIQNWYLNQCNGDWEHSYGIKISTLDNPGWEVEIDIIETDLENKEFQSTNVERSEKDWVRCDVQGTAFRGFGGPSNLSEILETFINWAIDKSKSNKNI
jgi:hypothetical protein